MNQQKSLLRISELLARFKFQTIILNSNAQLDINIVAEDILVPILNIAYSCKLQNAKYSESDPKFPALDLLDKVNKIAFQITSTSDIKKVRKTIEGVVKNNFQTQFDKFYVYIITQKQASYDKTVLASATQGLFEFTEKNVLDEKNLFQKIASLEYEKISTIEKLLENQFSDVSKSEELVQKNVSELILKIKNTYSEMSIIEELEGAYKTRQAWSNKKNFLENKLPTISDVSQQYTIYHEISEINNKIEKCDGEISELLTTINAK